MAGTSPAMTDKPLRQPALAAAVVLGLAVGFAGARVVQTEIELLDIGVLTQALSRSFQHDAPVLHDIAMIGDLERQRRVLLDEQHGNLLLVLEAPDHAEDLL